MSCMLCRLIIPHNSKNVVAMNKSISHEDRRYSTHNILCRQQKTVKMTSETMSPSQRLYGRTDS